MPLPTRQRNHPINTQESKMEITVTVSSCSSRLNIRWKHRQFLSRPAAHHVVFQAVDRRSSVILLPYFVHTCPVITFRMFRSDESAAFSQGRWVRSVRGCWGRHAALLYGHQGRRPAGRARSRSGTSMSTVGSS